MIYTPGNTDCRPEDVGYDSSRIPLLHAHFERMIAQKKIIGATYCAARHGKIFMHGAVGPFSYKDGETRPYKPTDLQYIASITKTFNTIAFMKLVEDGLVRLDTPVGDILPPFKEKPFDGINAYHILTHTSGMYPDGGCFENKHHMGQWGHIERYIKNYKPEDGEFDWLSAALACHPRKGIGEEWQYCSFGFTVIAAMIEKITGKPCHEYITDEIFKPLGMNDSCFDATLTPEMAANHFIHGEETEKYLERIIKGEKPSEEDWWDKIPGGGIISNAGDLIKYGMMLLNKGSANGNRIIGRKALEKITARALYDVPDFCWGADTRDRVYGIGFDMRQGPAFTYSQGTFMHEGAGACGLVMDPQEEMAAAWFVPFINGWHHEGQFNTMNIIWSGLK
jgi:CubicO group peptidase (beta-lactamase class C family)